MFESTVKNILEKLKPLANQYIDKSTLRNIFYMTAAMFLFMLGMLLYGIILNIREESLAESLMKKGFEKLIDSNILIDRENYTLNLYEDTVLVKSYRVSFGKNVHKAKQKAGDEATPVGEYAICSIDSSEMYTRIFRLNYPNIDDASNALRKGLISQKEFNQIKFEFYYEGCTKYNKVLGGEIGIHGIGRLNFIFKNLPFVYNWTNGSIAMSDEDIEELYSVVKIGTKVLIK